MEIYVTKHALFEALRRGISLDLIKGVAESPQQEIASTGQRKICQSKFVDKQTGKDMLIRVVIEDTDDVRYIITVYRTSKIDKYWEVTE